MWDSNNAFHKLSYETEQVYNFSSVTAALYELIVISFHLKQQVLDKRIKVANKIMQIRGHVFLWQSTVTSFDSNSKTAIITGDAHLIVI